MPTQLCVTSAAEEQRWIASCLEEPSSGVRWRLGSYSVPSVVMGCSQDTQYQAARAAASEANIELVKRQAGGGAVLAGPWLLSLAIVFPETHRLVAGGPMRCYRWLGAVHAGVLRDLGLPAVTVPPMAIPPTASLSWACFGGLSPWEVVVHGRKIVGLAQRRGRGKVLLVSGTLIDSPDWSVLCKLLGQSQQAASALRAATAAVNDLVATPVRVESQAWRLAAALEDILGAGGAPALSLASSAKAPVVPGRSMC